MQPAQGEPIPVGEGQVVAARKLSAGVGWVLTGRLLDREEDPGLSARNGAKTDRVAARASSSRSEAELRSIGEELVTCAATRERLGPRSGSENREKREHGRG